MTNKDKLNLSCGIQNHSHAQILSLGNVFQKGKKKWEFFLLISPTLMSICWNDGNLTNQMNQFDCF